MNLSCLTDIITDSLAINFDLSNIDSWNLNSGYTIVSLNKWNNSMVNDLTLNDFGLTAFDNGRTNSLNSTLSINQNNNKLLLYRIGYNDTIDDTIKYSGYSITDVTGSSVGTYFSLNGGYLQGFFKLEDYDFEVFPPRYNNGITIETIIEILSQSSGIFYYMGIRSEDKYNSYFSGETIIVSSSTINYSGNKTGYVHAFSGITTSEGNYLNSYDDVDVKLSAFSQPEYSEALILENIEQNDNISNNVISFEITSDRRIKYKYINENGCLIQNQSNNQINVFGWTIISIVFQPNEIINDFDNNSYKCYARRKGDLIFYINGRKFWNVEDFDEFYFKGITNNKEKQIGVPYNISWGGGSFGLKHSWHYDDFNATGITKDVRKDNLLIENYFNPSYIGNIQKLRIYNKALQSNEILHNAYVESKNNTAYNIAISKGGRIINSYQNVPYIPQQSSGSDIRKSIRYRNNDGTYRDLYQMLDIKVVIKSRSNPNIELVKFKKITETDWLQLIWVNDTTYDFIVPNTITSQHPNETLFAEIKFQWTDPLDIDNVFDKIFITNITTTNLVDNSIKNY